MKPFSPNTVLALALLVPVAASALDVRSARESLLHELRSTANGLGSGAQVGLITSLSPEDYPAEAPLDRRSLKGDLLRARFDPKMMADPNWKPEVSDGEWFKEFAPKLTARIEGLQTDEDVADFLARINGWVEENGKFYIDEQDGTNYLRPLLDAAHHVRQQLPEGLFERAGQTALAFAQGFAPSDRISDAPDAGIERWAAAENRVVSGHAAPSANLQKARAADGISELDALLARVSSTPTRIDSSEDRALREAMQRILQKAEEEDRATRERHAKYGLTLRESLAAWAEKSPWGQPFFSYHDLWPRTAESRKAAVQWTRNAAAAATGAPRNWFKKLFSRGEKDAEPKGLSFFERLRQIRPSNIWAAINERRKSAKEEAAKQKAERGPSPLMQAIKTRSWSPLIESFKAARAAKADTKKKKEAQPTLLREVLRARSLRPAIDRFKAWLLASKRKKQETPSFAADKDAASAKKITRIELSKLQRLPLQARAVALAMFDLAKVVGGDRQVLMPGTYPNDGIQFTGWQSSLPDQRIMNLRFPIHSVSSEPGVIGFDSTWINVWVKTDPSGAASEVELKMDDSLDPLASVWLVRGQAPRLVSVSDPDAATELFKTAENAVGRLLLRHAVLSRQQSQVSSAATH